MLTYEKLSRKPRAFRSMTGLNIEEFDQVFVELECYHPETEAERLVRPDRQRAPGAGGQFKHDLRTRLLMTLVWLRVYPILEVLGVLFELDKSSVGRNIKPILSTLEKVTCYDITSIVYWLQSLSQLHSKLVIGGEYLWKLRS